jgi:hypothetical protein
MAGVAAVPGCLDVDERMSVMMKKGREPSVVVWYLKLWKGGPVTGCAERALGNL